MASSSNRFFSGHLRPNLDDQFSFRSDDSFISHEGDEEATASTPDLQSVSTSDESSWVQKPLVVVVVGASGDLAKKKTYPSLFELYQHGLLPSNTTIWGYARSPKSHEELRAHLAPHLANSQVPHAEAPHNTLQHFLNMCYYHHGNSYGDVSAYSMMLQEITSMADFSATEPPNVLYYLAIPPNVFHETVSTLEQIPEAVVPGRVRFVIEKPFGHDTESCKGLLQNFQGLGEEMQYRIDHYVGKPMVENLVTLRMANPWLEHMWSHQFIESIHIRFKEPFGSQGRGGYFDRFGIIRDILQNHLLQVLLYLAMELPDTLVGGADEAAATKEEDHNDSFRQAKLAVLEKMHPILLEDSLLGQYEGYSDDPTIKNKDTNCPTYAALRCFVNNDRWKGVPFILEGGKALNEKVVDVQVKFKNRHPFPSNILAIEIQPKMTMSMTCHVKPLDLGSSHGTKSIATTSLMTNYPPPSNSDETRSKPIENAYTRLLWDVLRGKQNSFIRADELVASWELFTPLLNQIEEDNVQPIKYQYGSSGPNTRGSFLSEMTPSIQACL